MAPQQVPAVFEFTAEAQPSHQVEVRSLVQGTILDRYFVEGSDVKKGQQLFLIDPAIYQADSRTSAAAEEMAKANFEQAKRDLARGEALFKGGAISQRDYDVLLTRYQTTQADLAGTSATLEKANVDLRRTVIRAEIAGRIGTANLLTGAQVPGPSALLATIDQIDPIYVDLAISDNERLKYEDDVRNGRVTKPAKDGYRVEPSSLTAASSPTKAGSTSRTCGSTRRLARCASAPSSRTPSVASSRDNSSARACSGPRGTTRSSSPRRRCSRRSGASLSTWWSVTRRSPATCRLAAGSGATGSSRRDSIPATG